MKNVSKMILFVLGCELVGILSTPFTLASIPTWYATLTKPFLTPPNWVFAPAWTTLYFLMGVAAFLVWQKKVQGKLKQIKKRALQMFLLQLILNFFWSVIFFYFQQTFLAVVEIILLWIAIAYTIVLFKKLSYPAALLLVPYLLWVSFATYLTIGIWILNY